jgi:hypothetical protein
LRILTPARSNDFVVLKVSDEMLPSNRNVLGTAVAPVEFSDDSLSAFPAFALLLLMLLLLLVVAGFALMALADPDEDEFNTAPDAVVAAAVVDAEEGAEGSCEAGGGAGGWLEGWGKG